MKTSEVNMASFLQLQTKISHETFQAAHLLWFQLTLKNVTKIRSAWGAVNEELNLRQLANSDFIDAVQMQSVHSTTHQMAFYV